MAREAAAQNSRISVRVRGEVEVWPNATMARLSPTRIVSMPAWSAAWAEGKSWAVSTGVGLLEGWVLGGGGVVAHLL